jgi:hypothetical protein
VVDAWDSSWCGRRLTLLCLAAKLSTWEVDVDGLSSRLRWPTDWGYQMLVQSLLTGIVSSDHPAQVGTVSDPLSEGATMDRIPHIEARLYQGVFIRCHSYHGDYACSYSRVATSGGDGTDSLLKYMLPCTRGCL